MYGLNHVLSHTNIDLLFFFFGTDDGSMSNQLREKSLTTLKYDPKCTVMLISLKCGSLG